MSFVQLPADGVGKQVETNTPDGTNHRQVVTVGDKTATNTLAVDSSGRATVLLATTPVLVKQTDGTNAISKTYDVDSSGVTHEYATGVVLRKSASGASVEAGTATNPLRVDVTGTTVQPVSGTVTANAGTGNFTVVQGTGSNLHAVIDSGTVTANISGSISNTSFAATQSTAAALSGAWPVKVTDGVNTMPTGDTSARTIHTTIDNSSLAVTGTFWQATQPVSGTVTANQGGTWTVQPGNTANTTPWLVTTIPATSGGTSVYSAQNTGTKAQIKSGAGQIYGYHFLNTTAAIAYVQLFFALSASVTVGTTTPDLVIPLPASGGATIGLTNGMAFTTGLTVASTTTRTGSTGATVDCVVYYD